MYNTTAQRIKYLREKQGLTQEELAIRLGYKARSTITQFESGARELPRNLLPMLAKTLGCSEEYLKCETDIEEPLVNGDAELTEYLEELKNRPELKMMFSLTKNATKKDVEKAVAIVEAFLNGSNNE